MYNQTMKVIATNRRAKFDYAITENLLAGVVLSGSEVKSVKAGHISLKGSFATINRGELYLLNAHISPYKYAGALEIDETRSRKLLVHKKELERLAAMKQSGLSMVPMAVGVERGFVKIKIGIGRGKRIFDKRETIKKREAKREAAQHQPKP